MSNELDILMDRDPTDLSAQDIDSIITYHRKMRANFEAGIKPKKAGAEAAKAQLDKVVAKLTQPKVDGPKMRRI